MKWLWFQDRNRARTLCTLKGKLLPFAKFYSVGKLPQFLMIFLNLCFPSWSNWLKILLCVFSEIKMNLYAGFVKLCFVCDLCKIRFHPYSFWRVCCHGCLSASGCLFQLIRMEKRTWNSQKAAIWMKKEHKIYETSVLSRIIERPSGESQPIQLTKCILRCQRVWGDCRFSTFFNENVKEKSNFEWKYSKRRCITKSKI